MRDIKQGPSYLIRRFAEFLSNIPDRFQKSTPFYSKRTPKQDIMLSLGKSGIESVISNSIFYIHNCAFSQH